MTNDKYKDALAKARQAYGSGAYDDATLEAIFPELRESERIRKELIDAFAAYDIESSWNGIPVSSVLAWLKKKP